MKKLRWMLWDYTWTYEPRDIWIGLYWTWQGSSYLHFYFCFVPCFPLHLQFQKRKF